MKKLYLKIFILILSFSLSFKGQANSIPLQENVEIGTLKHVSKEKAAKSLLENEKKEEKNKKKSFLSKKQKDLLYFTLKGIIVTTFIIIAIKAASHLLKPSTMSVEVAHKVDSKSLDIIEHLPSQIGHKIEETLEKIRPIPSLFAVKEPLNTICQDKLIEVTSPGNKEITTQRAENLTKQDIQSISSVLSQTHYQLTNEAQARTQEVYNQINDNILFLSHALAREKNNQPVNSSSSSSSSPQPEQENKPLPISAKKEIMETLFSSINDYQDSLTIEDISTQFSSRVVTQEIGYVMNTAVEHLKPVINNAAEKVESSLQNFTQSTTRSIAHYAPGIQTAANRIESLIHESGEKLKETATSFKDGTQNIKMGIDGFSKTLETTLPDGKLLIGPSFSFWGGK